MLGITGVLLAAAVMILLDWPQLRKRRHRRETANFFLLLAVGIALWAALLRHWPIPNPLDPALALFKPLSDLLYSLL